MEDSDSQNTEEYEPVASPSSPPDASSEGSEDTAKLDSSPPGAELETGPAKSPRHDPPKQASPQSCEPEGSEADAEDAAVDRFFNHANSPNNELSATAGEDCENNDSLDVDPIDDYLFSPVASEDESFSGGSGLRSIHIRKEMTPIDSSCGHHTLLVDRNALQVGAIVSHPEKFVDKWHADYFRMACSKTANLDNSKTTGLKLWEVIQANLSREIFSVDDLLTAMEAYSPGVCKISGYRKFLSREEAFSCLINMMPKLRALALDLPRVVTQPIPLLKQGVSASLTLSQHQIAVLLANAFFNTHPRQLPGYPVPINCKEMFNVRAHDREKSSFAKIRCLLNYLERVCNSTPQGLVTFHRRVLDQQDRPQWEKLNVSFTKCHIKSQGLIEEHEDMLQVDFANKFVGGGVLRTGCVQEEIRFIICPELIASRFFTQQLLDNEVLIIQGAERYSYFSGYARTFKYTGDYIDTTQQDPFLRRYTTVVAMDASVFRVAKSQQFNPPSMIRELNKAYLGFKPIQSVPDVRPTAVVTGNWGCGAFGGDPLLKFVLQWMAASLAGRDMVYLTFENVELARKLANIVSFVNQKPLVISQMWRMLCQYNRNKDSNDLYKFLCG